MRKDYKSKKNTKKTLKKTKKLNPNRLNRRVTLILLLKHSNHTILSV